MGGGGDLHLVAAAAKLDALAAAVHVAHGVDLLAALFLASNMNRQSARACRGVPALGRDAKAHGVLRRERLLLCHLPCLLGGVDAEVVAGAAARGEQCGHDRRDHEGLL